MEHGSADLPLPEALTGRSVWKADTLDATRNRLTWPPELAKPRDSHLLRAFGTRLGIAIAEGPGFVVVDGVPVEGGDSEVSESLLTIARHLGRPLEQYRTGVLVDFVRDERTATPRGAKTSAELIFHTDLAHVTPDLFGLLVVREAAAGGMSLVASGHALYNDLLQERPDLLHILLRPFYFDGSDGHGDIETFQSPVFTRRHSLMSVRYNRARIHRGHRAAGARLDSTQREALDWVDGWLLRPGSATSFRLRRGQLFVADNHVILHGRSGFDDPEDTAGRLLLRVWIAV